MDKVIVHEIEDYYQLPDGARLMKRNGMADVWEYRFIEHVRAHNVEHVYKVARVSIFLWLTGTELQDLRRNL